MRYTGLKTTVQALIEITPTPMRHSSVTLGFFDLLFSHEPSLMARIRFVQKCHTRLVKREQKAEVHQEKLLKTQQLENVRAAVKEQTRRERLIVEAAHNTCRCFEYRRYEETLALKATKVPVKRDQLALSVYQDPQWEVALKDSETDNTRHPLYGKSLVFGLQCAMKAIRTRIKAFSKKKGEANRQPDLGKPSEKAPNQTTQSEA